jgi:hypothetical protein
VVLKQRLDLVSAWRRDSVSRAPVKEQRFVETDFETGRVRVEYAYADGPQRVAMREQESQPAVTVRDQGDAIGFRNCREYGAHFIAFR